MQTIDSQEMWDAFMRNEVKLRCPICKKHMESVIQLQRHKVNLHKQPPDTTPKSKPVQKQEDSTENVQLESIEIH